MNPRENALGGPLVAQLFQKLLAATFLVAWASLGSQIDVLAGSHGLLPANTFAQRLAARPDLTYLDVPTFFRGTVTDGALHGWILVGILLAVLAFLGAVPRIAFALSTVLYLSFAVTLRNFLSFQWDNLLLECGFLAVFLPTNRRAPWIHVLLRVLLCKLYFESGIAKYQSAIGDWKDGSAMAAYYETAPLPTWLAWYAHHLPAWWHTLESRATLAFELGVPFLIFLPRPFRFVAISVFTTFQVANILTANYGFFSYLALILSVLLLEDRDIATAARAIRNRARRHDPGSFNRTRRLRARFRLSHRRYRRWVAKASARLESGTSGSALFLGRLTVAVVVTSAYLAVSVESAFANFLPNPPKWELLSSFSDALRPFRIVNTYHLFGQITRERVEPTFETFDGTVWTEHELHYKPGDVMRAPPFVAPHQPRVDFLLWFYGLGYERGVPLYVKTLLDRLCEDPSAVAPLFAGRLPDAPVAARVRFYQYHFTTSEERRQSGAYWTREAVGSPRAESCGAVRDEAAKGE